MGSLIKSKYKLSCIAGKWLVQEGQRHIDKDGTVVYWWKTIFCSRDFMESFKTMRIMCTVNMA